MGARRAVEGRVADVHGARRAEVVLRALDLRERRVRDDGVRAEVAQVHGRDRRVRVRRRSHARLARRDAPAERRRAGVVRLVLGLAHVPQPEGDDDGQVAHDQGEGVLWNKRE